MAFVSSSLSAAPQRAAAPRARCSTTSAQRTNPLTRPVAAPGIVTQRSPFKCTGPAAAHRLSLTRATSSTSAAEAPTSSVDSIVASLKAAAKAPGSVPPQAVLKAIIELEKLKLDPSAWPAALAAPGRKWRLVFTAASGEVKKATKGEANKGAAPFPLTAAQRFDPASSDFENGVFLGNVGYLTFNGPYAVRGRQLSFDVVRMNLGLGPLRFSIPLKSNAPASLAELPDAQRKALPFFLYAYVDDEMVVARGRSGGLALWLKTTSDFEAQAGLLQRYTQ